MIILRQNNFSSTKSNKGSRKPKTKSTREDKQTQKLVDEVLDVEKDLGDKKELLENLRTPKPEPHIPTRKEKLKKLVSDPKFKKGVKIAGITALGIGASVAAGKLISKKMKEKKQEEAKKRIIGEKTDKDVRKAVKGTEAEEKVNKILDKSGKDMKNVSQKEYAAISDEGRVAMRSKEALEKAHELGYTRKQAVTAAKRFLDRARDDMNDQEKVIRVASKTAQRQHRNRIGFIKDTVSGCDWKEQKFGRIKIGFHPDYTETSGQKIKLGFKKFSKQTREVVPEDIVKKVKNGGGVIQKDHNGDWRIISMKTKTNKSGKPEFWDARYDSKEAASKALGGYFANK